MEQFLHPIKSVWKGFLKAGLLNSFTAFDSAEITNFEPVRMTSYFLRFLHHQEYIAAVNRTYIRNIAWKAFMFLFASNMIPQLAAIFWFIFRAENFRELGKFSSVHWPALYNIAPANYVPDKMAPFQWTPDQLQSSQWKKAQPKPLRQT